MITKPRYAGIGSRKVIELAPELEGILAAIARALDANDFILRSGGAIGCDLWFEAGVPNPENKEIFYSNKKIPYGANPDFYTVDEKAFAVAKSVHPKWSAMNEWGQGLHARNTYQILGRNHDHPVDFVICWTLGGIAAGGTRTAIVLAEKHSIPVLNLGIVKDGRYAEAFENFMLMMGYSINLQDYML